MTRTAYETHCATLGVQPGASPDEIKSAFRRLAKQHHPDTQPDGPLRVAAGLRFEGISVAYEALRDGARPADARDSWTPPPGPAAPEPPPRPIHVPWIVAVRGGEVTTTGRGWHLLVLRVPSGSDDGTQLRAAHHGTFVVHVMADGDARWTRKGDDLEGELAATWLEAWRGDLVEVTTPWGTTSVSLPAGVLDGQVLEAVGHGCRPPARPWGSLRLTVRLRPPPPQVELEPHVAEALAEALRDAYADDS